MDSRLTDAQRDLDGLLPVFVTATVPDRYVDTTWTNLADLALFHGESVGGRAGVRSIEGVAPSRNPRAVTFLPAGSCLRFIGTFWDYLASTVLMLTVEGGPASGMTVSLTTDDRWLAPGSVHRRTAAAALIVPADGEIADLAGVANVRLRWLQAIEAGIAAERGIPDSGGQRDRPAAGGDPQFTLWREDQLGRRGISRQAREDEGAPSPKRSPGP